MNMCYQKLTLKEIRKSIDFLKDYLKENPFLKTYVLGISEVKIQL